ncbi:hypothetical protein SprV_0702346600 [Sparganum proliferum]
MGGSQITSASPPQCQPSAAFNTPARALPTRIPRTNRFCWIPSDSVHHQPDEDYLFSHSANSAPIAIPVTGNRTGADRPPPSTDTLLRPAPIPASFSVASSSSSSSTTTTTTTTTGTTTSSRTSPIDGTTSDVLQTSNINSSTSSDVDSVHTCPRCDRTFTSRIACSKSSYRVGRTSARSTNMHSPHPPQLPSLHPHIHPPHGLLGHMCIYENLR